MRAMTIKFIIVLVRDLQSVLNTGVSVIVTCLQNGN